jgi:hypothetical protein
MSCVWSLDAGTFCHVVPVVGTKLLPTSSGGEGIANALKNLDEDEMVTVDLTINKNDTRTIHKGFPIVTHMESTSGSSFSSLSRSIGINSRLDLLSAVTPATRVFFNKEVTPDARSVAVHELASLSDGSIVSFFFAKNITVVNLSSYIIELLDKLQKAFRAAGGQKTPGDQQVSEILSTKKSYVLTDAISAGDRANTAAAIQVQTARRSKVLSSSTFFGAIMDFNNMAFLHTVPADLAKGTYHLGPILPLVRR